MSCSFIVSQCFFYCFGSVMQCLGRCLETYANLGYMVFDLFFISLSWLVTFALSKILVYISEDFKFKIAMVFGSLDFPNIQLFILLRICICLIFLHFLLALGAFLRIKFFRILHQGLWSFKAFVIAAGFAGLIFVPIRVIQIFLKSLTFVLALNFLVNLCVLLRYKKHTTSKWTCFLEFILNSFLMVNLVMTLFEGLPILTLDGQNTLYIMSGVLLCINLIRCIRRKFAYYVHNLILQLYCVLLLWTGWLLLQEKDHLEKITIAFSMTIGLVNLIIPILVVLSPSQSSDGEEEPQFEIVKEEDEDEEEEDLEKPKIKAKKQKKFSSPRHHPKKSKTQRENSKISLVHFSFMFLVSYFLETFICLENLEENLWQFHSHPYVFFIIAIICLLLICRFTI